MLKLDNLSSLFNNLTPSTSLIKFKIYHINPFQPIINVDELDEE